MQFVDVDVGRTGLVQADLRESGLSTGTAACMRAASCSSMSRVNGTIASYSARTLVGLRGGADEVAPRGVRIGCAAKPAGGCTRNGRVARVSARTCGEP